MATSDTAQRNHSIDLLRILLMLMIIVHHYTLYSGFDFAVSGISAGRLWIQFLRMGGKVGVNGFVMITGYFMIVRERIRAEKCIHLIAKIFIVSVLTTGIFAVFHQKMPSAEVSVKRLFPTIFAEWPFLSAYVVLYLIIPFLNRFLKALDRKTFRNLLILMTVLWSVIPTLTTSRFQSNYLIWMVYCYSLAAYCRLFRVVDQINAKKALILSATGAALLFLATVALDMIGMRVHIIGEHATFLYDKQSVPIVFISLMLFLRFAAMRQPKSIRTGKWISTAAAGTLGVFLLHEGRYTRDFIWKTLFHGRDYANSFAIVPYSLAVPIAVFVACAILDWLLEHTIMLGVDAASTRCIALWGKCIQPMSKRIRSLSLGRFIRSTPTAGETSAKREEEEQNDKL